MILLLRITEKQYVKDFVREIMIFLSLRLYEYVIESKKLIHIRGNSRKMGKLQES